MLLFNLNMATKENVNQIVPTYEGGKDKIRLLAFVIDAIKFRIQIEEKSRYFSDDYLFGYEKILLALNSLKPKEFKQVVLVYSSYNWGRHILTEIFPRIKNPNNYGSTNGCVNLSDNPIQVYGWDYEKEQTQLGIDKGLIEEWISAGFGAEAEARGIDLEWHFFQTPRETPQTLIHQLHD